MGFWQGASNARPQGVAGVGPEGNRLRLAGAWRLVNGSEARAFLLGSRLE